MGERGLWYKMTLFEWAARVPLLFYAPGRFAARRVSSHVSLVDLLPTIVELAAGRPNPEWAGPLDGRSLVPLLQGQEAEGSRRVLGEILCEGAIAPCFMIRRGRYKYIHSAADPEQLFDLEADRHELHYLADRPGSEGLQRAFRAKVWRMPRAGRGLPTKGVP